MVFKKKQAVAINTLFFILMGLFFVGILIYGGSQIFFIQEEMDEQELQLLQVKLQKELNYCEDPLNEGSTKRIDITSPEFNVICLLGSDFDKNSISSLEGIEPIFEGGDNVVLINSNLVNQDISYDDSYIVSSLKVDYYREIDTKCWIQDDEGELFIELICK